MKVDTETLRKIQAALDAYEAEVDTAALADATKTYYKLQARRFVSWLQIGFGSSGFGSSGAVSSTLPTHVGGSRGDPIENNLLALQAVRTVLIERLRPRLEATWTDHDGMPVATYSDQKFVKRFGVGLHKLSDSDIAALTLYLPQQESFTAALAELTRCVKAARQGKTRLPYFDEWGGRGGLKARGIAWSHDYQEEIRSALKKGWRLERTSKSDSVVGQFRSGLSQHSTHHPSRR